MFRVIGTPVVALLAVSMCRHDPDVVSDTDEPSVVDDTDLTADSDAADACLAGGPVLRIGRGYLAYEPVEPGSELLMVHGPQGGWHVEIAFQAENVPQVVTLEWRATVIETGVDVTANGDDQAFDAPIDERVMLVPTPTGPWACTGEWPGERNVFDFRQLADVPATDPWRALCGVPIRIEAAIREPGAGATLGDVLATTALDVVLQPDPADGPPCR
jgi:hypothetical protein